LKKTDVLLDLLPDPEPEVQIAHDSEEKEEKEEIEQGPITVKRSKKSSDTDDEDDDLQSQLVTIAKYGLIGTGIAFLLYQIFFNKKRRKKEPDTHELMMVMLTQMMMMQMQQMQKQMNPPEKTLPPEIATDDGTKFSTDWSDWYEENKDKQIKQFGDSKNKILNQMHIAENWKVRRTLNGEILDVSKTNEYIR
jgi:hypothetical protein